MNILYVSSSGLPVSAPGIRMATIGAIMKKIGCKVHYLCNRRITDADLMVDCTKIEPQSFSSYPQYCLNQGEKHFMCSGNVYSYLPLRHTKATVIGDCIDFFLASRIFKRIKAISLIVWGNSGMMGPVIVVACGLILFLIRCKNYKKYIAVLLTNVVIALFFMSSTGISIIDYLMPSISNISFVERSRFRIAALNYLQGNWVIVDNGMLGELTQVGIDPHEFPLRMACLFGFVSGIVCLTLIYVIPVIDIFKRRPKNNNNCIWYVLYAIMAFVSIANNYIMLLWFIFSESMIQFEHYRDNYKLNTDTLRNVKEVGVLWAE